ncbi:right-handed parallel beta-helix repeat-containing protein [bacterium]|nr:right-handed parallel beta-helix repeat-containing protein [bacterium]
MKANTDWIKATVLLALLPSVAATTIITVDQGGGGDYHTLAEGLAAASNGDTVLVGPGLYVGPQNRDLSFFGRDIVLLSEEGSAATVIDCEHLSRAFTFNSGEGYQAVVEGFTLTNGYAQHDTLNPYEGYGGAIHCYNSNPTLRDLAFVGNSSDNEGGALSCLYLESSAITVSDCRFESNSSHHGGAVTAKYSRMRFFDCSFSNNTGENWGGALLLDDWPCTLTRCDFYGNRGDMGAAVNFRGSDDHYITECTFEGNVAADWGGALGSYQSRLRVTNCIFIGNHARYHGSAIALSTQTFAEITGCTFAGNTGDDYVGTVSCYKSSPAISNCTFFGNISPGGGTILCRNDSEPDIINTVFALQWDGAVILCDHETCAPQISFSCVFGNAGGDTLCGTYHDILLADPLLCMAGETPYGLQDCSPCIGTGFGGVNIGAWDVSCACAGTTGVAEVSASLPTLLACAYDRSTDSVTIEFENDGVEPAVANIYDVAGRRVARLSGGTGAAGVHELVWKCSSAAFPRAASGVYFVELRCGEGVARGRILVLR